jgi:PAS domain S-box-containing protein
MNIRVVIRQGVVFVSAVVVAGTVFLAAAHVLRRITGPDRDDIPVFQAVVAALVLAVLFGPFKGWIQRSFNRYLYRETYDYQRTVRDASRRINAMLELEPLLTYLTRVVGTTFKTEELTLYLRHPSRQSIYQRIEASTSGSSPTAPAELPETSPVVTFLATTNRALVREEALREDSPLVSMAGKALGELGGDIAFPLPDDLALGGLVVIGAKRSGDPYYSEDIDLLDTLIAQAAIAMKNAQLYREVVHVKEYLDNILSTMDSGVIAINAQGNIALFNSAAERLTGVTVANATNNSLGCLPSALARPLQATLQDQAPRSQFETSIHGHQGTIIPVVCSTSALMQGPGDAHGALIVFSDLTQLKDLEQEKRRVERLASFGALASGVAHEIKNPLVAIRTFAELLPERFLDEDFREDFSKVVIREISRIDDLVARLRGIAGTAPRQTGPTDLREPLSDTLALLRAQFEHTRTVVHCDFSDSAPLVSVDEAQLKQLFLNLILNAVEAMGSGGALDIRVSRREAQGVAWVVTEVIDTGPGIS